MILSLINLDLNSPSVRQSFRNCQDLHRNIMKAFDTCREESNVLFRIIRSDKSINIYVQSMAEPHWSRTVGNGLNCIQTKDISKLPASFKKGQILHFSLFSCPSKKVVGEGKNNRRVLLRGEESQLDWLKRQGKKNGFSIKQAFVKGKGETVTGKKASGEFRISGVSFDGVLQIEDVEAFRKCFINGIGPEKAYGFGMLMVAKVA